MKTAALTRPLPIRHRNDPCCDAIQSPRLTATQTAVLADRFKAVGDPTRLRMLDLLAQQNEPMCVCDITEQFTQNQPTISHHLKALREVGLIDTGKQGIWAYYWATDLGRRTLTAVASLV